MKSIWQMNDDELWPELRKAQRTMVYFRDEVPDLETSDTFADRVTDLYEEIKKRGLD